MLKNLQIFSATNIFIRILHSKKLIYKKRIDFHLGKSRSGYITPFH